MSKLPISIEKIKIDIPPYYFGGDSSVTEAVRYLFKLEEKGHQWEKSFTCDRDELIKFRELIDQLIENTSTSETLKIQRFSVKIFIRSLLIVNPLKP